MRFRLRYRGTLDTREGRAILKQRLRRYFHPQIRSVCHHLVETENKGTKPRPEKWDPFKAPKNAHDVGVLESRGLFQFVPIVSQAYGWNAVAALDILFLRPQPPGYLVKKNGDLDNRIKLLIDGLRMPHKSEIPIGDKPSADEDPLYVLLRDDALINRISIESDTLFNSESDYEVEIIIGVDVRSTHRTMYNSPIW